MRPVSLIPQRLNAVPSELDAGNTENEAEEEQWAIDGSWSLKRASDKEANKEDSKHDMKQVEKNPSPHSSATGRPYVVAHECIAGFNPNSVRDRLGFSGTHVTSDPTPLRLPPRPIAALPVRHSATSRGRPCPAGIHGTAVGRSDRGRSSTP